MLICQCGFTHCSSTMHAALKMKDLAAQTGVSREAIHFYLREGLLPQPEKPKRNVAFYSHEHVLRIRAIKQLQQEQSMSLQAIKRVLATFDYDSLAAAGDLAEFELAIQTRLSGDMPAPDQKLADVAKATGLAREFIEQLAALGVIRLKSDNRLDFRDVGILEQWGRLMRAGFADQRGYDANYLARFATAISSIAELEVSQFLDVFGAIESDRAAQLAADGIAITNEIVSRLRTQALMRALHDRVEADAQPA